MYFSGKNQMVKQDRTTLLKLRVDVHKWIFIYFDNMLIDIIISN